MTSIQQVIVLAIVIGVFLWGILDHFFKHRARIFRHKERLAAIEKGLDLSALPADEQDRRLELMMRLRDEDAGPPHPRHYLLTGMVWLAIGIGIGAFFLSVTPPPRSAAWMGVLPIGIGVAYLIFYFTQRKELLAELERKSGQS